MKKEKQKQYLSSDDGTNNYFHTFSLMEYLALLGTVTVVHLLAVVSPGPDFIMACRNSLTYSRSIGIWTAVGFGMGITVHILYCLAGIGFIISQSVLLFTIIKLLGAGYLIYIGIKSFFAKSSAIEITTIQKKKDFSPWKAVQTGFLTNALNPKATLFFLSLFTLVISPTTPIIVVGIASLIMVLNTILWFSLVAAFLTQPRIRHIFEKFQTVFNKVFGGLLVALGIKIAISN